jgi:hypothetical protein
MQSVATTVVHMWALTEQRSVATVSYKEPHVAARSQRKESRMSQQSLALYSTFGPTCATVQCQTRVAVGQVHVDGCCACSQLAALCLPMQSSITSMMPHAFFAGKGFSWDMSRLATADGSCSGAADTCKHNSSSSSSSTVITQELYAHIHMGDEHVKCIGLRITTACHDDADNHLNVRISPCDECSWRHTMQTLS